MTKTALFSRRQPGGVFSIYDEEKTTGSIFWVHSGTGTDSAGAGQNPDSPFATIDYAIGKCTANKGDRIMVMPGHNEGLASGQTIDADVAGISIIGMGVGTLRPRIDFDHATASLDVGANNVTIKNLTFLPSVATVAKGIDIESGVTGTLIDSCEFLDGEASGTDEFVIAICLTAGNTGTVISDCVYRVAAAADGAVCVVKLDDACDAVVIRDCQFWGPYSTAAAACINGDTGASTNLLIDNCVLVTDNEPGIELLTGTTGVIRDVDIFTDLATIAAATVADGMAHFRVNYVEVGNESAATVKAASAND